MKSATFFPGHAISGLPGTFQCNRYPVRPASRSRLRTSNSGLVLLRLLAFITFVVVDEEGFGERGTLGLFVSLLDFFAIAPCDFLADCMRNLHDESISHAECALPIGHSRIRPTFWETLKLVELIRDEASESSVDLNDMFES